MDKNKNYQVIKLDTDERIVLSIMNLQVCIQNLLSTGDPKAALPALEESLLAIDPLATQILNKMVKQPTAGRIIKASKPIGVDFSKKIRLEDIETETETEEN